MKPIRITVRREKDRDRQTIFRASLKNDRGITASSPKSPLAAARRLASKALLPKMPSASRGPYEEKIAVSALDAAQTEFIAELKR